MLEYIRLKNLLNLHKKYNIVKNLKKGIYFVNFKRSVLEKQFYTFVGYSISYRNRGIGSSFTIRNVIKSYSIEYTFSKYSPLIRFYIKSNNLISIRNKWYYIRKKPIPYSYIKFNYIT
jgi:ribosomal protein L19